MDMTDLIRTQCLDVIQLDILVGHRPTSYNPCKSVRLKVIKGKLSMEFSSIWRQAEKKKDERILSNVIV